MQNFLKSLFPPSAFQSHTPERRIALITHHQRSIDSHCHLCGSSSCSSSSPASAPSCSVGSSHSPWDTKLAASDFHANIPDFPDGVVLETWERVDKCCCNWRTNMTCTTQLVGERCGAKSWENSFENASLALIANLTFTDSSKLKHNSTASLVSICEIFVKFSMTRHSIRLRSLGKHKRFASSKRFKHLSADTGGISSVYK